MASRYNVDSCLVCKNAFNTSHRQSVTLPCGHDFCLSCLFHLKASGKHQCPTCRLKWAGFEVPALPGMEALATALQEDQEDEGDMATKKGMFDRCEKHSRHYEYWAVDIKEFYCANCIVANPPTKLELIDDAIPQIKAAIALDVPNAKKEIANFLDSLDEMHAELVKKRNNLREFMDAALTLDDNFNQEIRDVASVRSQALDTASELNKMEEKMNSFTTTADVHVAVECKSTLKKVAAPLSVPTSDLQQTLLCNIVCSYVEEAVTANPPDRASFIYAVMKGGPNSLLEIVHSSKKLTGGQEWTVDNHNCEAALLALADRQPSVLSLVARDDAREALPVAAVAKAAKGCVVQARFVDTFYSADNTATDAGRLMDLTANQSLRLTEFYGHLDHSAIAKLPHTITWLGLAIGSAADAAAVSGLRPWEGLISLRVFVSSRVAARDLKPLPSIEVKGLFFPFLSDARVDTVRPAIEALAPDLWIYELYFPKSQLTAAGARRLTQRLRGVTVERRVTIEASGTWRPRAEEKESLAAEFRTFMGCVTLMWSMDWIVWTGYTNNTAHEAQR